MSGLSLSGAHMLVTGASRGIGELVARRAAARGARVTVVARSADKLEKLAADIGGHALPADLAEPEQVRGLIARAEKAAGPIDVLHNNASLDAVAGLLEVDAEHMAQLFSVNLLAPTELIRQALPGMLERGRGHIVTTSSGFSTITAQGLVPYAASKAAISSFHDGVRAEMRGTPLGFTLIELGPVKTEMYDDILEQRLAAPALQRLVKLQLAREVDPDDVAQAVVEAIEKGNQHVVLPRRMVPVVGLDWFPRRLVDLVLTGLPRR